MKPRWYGRYAWLIFFVFGVLLLWYGIYLFLLPLREPHHWNWLSKDPEVVRYIAGNFRWQGLLVTGFALLVLTSSATSFRKGEKWAWYTYWFFPVFWLTAMFVTWPGVLLTPFFILSVAGLLLPYHAFFRERLDVSPGVRGKANLNGRREG